MSVSLFRPLLFVLLAAGMSGIYDVMQDTGGESDLLSVAVQDPYGYDAELGWTPRPACPTRPTSTLPSR